MSLSFKKRVAFHFVVATAIVVAVVFGIVYFIVQKTVYKNIDDDLSFEAHKHTHEVFHKESEIRFINKDEWEESEHKEVQVNPVFIQLTNKSGEVMDKSPNLKKDKLDFKNKNEYGNHFNSHLHKRLVRQVQLPLYNNGKTNGFIIAAMSLDGSLMVLKNLRYTLLFLYPIVLLGLFFISSFLAGRSISPVVLITDTANRITKNNLNERIELPQNEDELYDLSSSINSLIGRLEQALEREKQFTSDASHELRTPISVLRGTLEVLNRKDRSVDEYKEKIDYCLTELDRMTVMTEQLLTLARFNSNLDFLERPTATVNEILSQIIIQSTPIILKKNININLNSLGNDELQVYSFHANLILENIISNAIKYSHSDGKIEIKIEEQSDLIICKIKDFGLGIKETDLEKIYTPFFRSNSLNHKEIKGVGLGLSIVQKAAKDSGTDLKINSKIGVGTEMTAKFKAILRE